MKLLQTGFALLGAVILMSGCTVLFPACLPVNSSITPKVPFFEYSPCLRGEGFGSAPLSNRSL